MKKFNFSAILIALAFYCQSSWAISCANCSTFYQQMFEYVEAVNTALSTAESLQTQTKQYQNMVTQGTGLPSSMFGSVASDLQSVVDTYNRSMVLGRQIQDMDSQFNQQFPGFERYLNAASRSEPAAASDQYEKWSETSRESVKAALQAADMNISMFDSEDALLGKMVSRSQSASGRMQAIQAGNEIASQNVQQLQKLRDLLATQISLQGNYMAQQSDRQASNDATEQQFKVTETTRGGAKGY